MYLLNECVNELKNKHVRCPDVFKKLVKCSFFLFNFIFFWSMSNETTGIYSTLYYSITFRHLLNILAFCVNQTALAFQQLALPRAHTRGFIDVCKLI